jgi:hypothetical protein
MLRIESTVPILSYWREGKTTYSQDAGSSTAKHPRPRDPISTYPVKYKRQ